MRILFLGNNWTGWQVLRWMREQGEEIAGIVVHPAQRQSWGKEILQAAGLNPSLVFDGAQLGSPQVLESIRNLRADIGVSALFGYLLRPSLLGLLPAGCINLHSALLPYNRGANPNVWSIVEGTPAGVTLHYIDEGTDTGDIIAQREVPIEAVDTGKSLYRKLELASVKLFMEAWPLVRAGKAPRKAQDVGAGTFHRTCDTQRLDEIALDRSYTGREVINILRARTFYPFRGAYFRDGDRKVYVRVHLEYEQSGSEKNGNGEQYSN